MLDEINHLELIARLLSNRVLADRIEEQKRRLAQSEIKLLQAQINPHILFNALNTLGVIRRDPEAARQLVQYLSTFFRKSLKRVGNETSLGNEIERVDAYLRIELALAILAVGVAAPQHQATEARNTFKSYL